ncbi:MAG TPA: tetratricopeptide repeat protein [Bryobacteraceae bacterium]|nr:tetratricopeptide repeat protein [Bryobacteraceae bacterium]
MRKVLIWIIPVLAGTILAYAADGALERAQNLYQQTNYRESLAVLESASKPSAEEYCLIGRNYLMLADFKKATDALQKAVEMNPSSSDYYLWLGRAWGRRAEAASPFTAPLHAAKARQAFERAVQLDGRNLEAINDLFDYYLEAPGFLGGGLDKAAALAERIGQLNPAEYHYAEAKLFDKRNEHSAAEQHFRRAVQLAPRQVGRLIDLARFLAKQGRVQESDAVFEQAQKLAPDSPKVLFWRAKTYVQEGQNLDKAQKLLKRYLQSDLTPDDPSRQEAEKLLRKSMGA